MTNEAKIIGMSLIFTIGLNLLVVPMVSDDGGGVQLTDLTPPETDILPDAETIENAGGALETIAAFASELFGIFVGIWQIILWFLTTVFSLLFAGVLTFNPILLLVNLIVNVVTIIAIIKVLPTT